MTEPERHLVRCAAALLEQGRTIDRLSHPLTVAALIGMGVYPAMTASLPAMTTPLVGVVMWVAVAGLVEAYFGIRVGLDATLFRQLANGSGAHDFAGTDAALIQLGLRPAATPDRPAGARVAGAKRLFECQVLALVAQVLALLVGTWIALMWR